MQHGEYRQDFSKRRLDRTEKIFDIMLGEVLQGPSIDVWWPLWSVRVVLGCWTPGADSGEGL